MKLKKKQMQQNVTILLPNSKKDESSELLSTRDKNFSELIGESVRIQEKCKDYLVSRLNSQSLIFNTDSLHVSFQPDGEHYLANQSISRWSLGQLCNKIGVPAQYIIHCIKNGEPSLAVKNMTTWLDRYDKPTLLRTYGNVVRGILSSSYQKFDAPDILGSVENEVSGMKVCGSYISPEKLHVRLRSEVRLDIPGEDYYTGLQIDSSDIGRNSLSVSYFIYKKVCSNGLILPIKGFTIFKQKHISKSTGNVLEESFDKGLSYLPEFERIVARFIEMGRNSGEVLKSFDEEQLGELEDRLKEHMSAREAKDVVIKFNERVNTKMLYQYENNNVGLANAITEVARDSSIDRRILLERYAGRVVRDFRGVA